MRTRMLAVLLCIVVCVVAVVAQIGGREPLNQKEISDLRDTAQEPEKRMTLMVQFARARLATIEQLRGDPRFAADRGPRIHDLLEDFTKLVDEMGDNIDDYSTRKEDLRKALKVVIEGDTDMQLKLRSLKEQGPGAGGKTAEVQEYTFVLQSATEAVNTGLDDARKLLAEQEVAFKDAKEKAKKKKSKD